MHTIQLGEPWTVQSQPGSMIYRRHFNRPTGLGPNTVVRLAIDDLLAGSKVSLNTQSLASDGSAAWDITPWLQPRNAVEISVASEALAEQRPFVEVRLEISERSRTPAA